MVETATVEDLEELLVLAKAMHSESPRFRGVPFHEAKTSRVLRAVILAGGALVSKKEGRIVGAICGAVVEHLFSADRYATDLGLFVLKEHRHGGLAAQLIKSFESWAQANGAHEVVLGVSTEVHAERTAQLYQRLGYAPTGYTLRKTLDV